MNQGNPYPCHLFIEEKPMKIKITAILLALLMLAQVSLTACSNAGGTEE